MTSDSQNTDTLMNRVDTLVKSVDRSPAGAAGRLIIDLEATLVKLDGILHKAWTHCGKNPKGDDPVGVLAYNRYVEVLRCYERGTTAVNEYRGGGATHRNVS